MPRLLLHCALTVLFLPVLGAAEQPEIVQIDVQDVLNARVITVVKDGAPVPLSDDIDGAGGLATKAASTLMGNKDAHPLPDDATFSATDHHPRVVLHYINGDTTAMQARRMQGEDAFFFSVPPGHYTHLHVFCTSGWGASQIQVKLLYADQPVERRSLEVPDWFWELKPDDALRSYLASNLGKWNKKNEMVEQEHHFIFALDLTPSSEKVLTRVGIHKLQPGLLGFYGATGTLAPKTK